MRRVDPHVPIWPSLFILSLTMWFILSCSAQDESRIPEESISVPASSLPEAKTDPHVTESQGNQISGVVRTIFQDSRGHFWFGTQSGWLRHDGASLTYFDLRDQFGNSLTGGGIVEDREGHLWLGSTTGLFKYDGRGFTDYSAEEGIDGERVWSMLLDSTGVIWIGTTSGVSRLERGKLTPFPLPLTARDDSPRGVSGPNIVWSMEEDQAGHIWFAADSGVYKYDGDTVTRVHVMDESSHTWVGSIMEDRKGNMWFGTSLKGLIRFDGEVFTNITETEGLDGVEVGGLYEDRSGNIWFTSEGFGIYRYDGKSFVNFFEQSGLDSHAPHCVMEDDHGRIWVGGWLGAYRKDGDSFVNVTRDGPW